MLLSTISPTEKRQNLRKLLASNQLIQCPGAFSPLVAMMIERLGFSALYISGAVLANDLGYPDIGLTTLSEVAQRGRQIARATNLPAIIDCDTGFGEVVNVARSIRDLEEAGLSGCHLEDQVNPKRCGHLDNKDLVSTDEMVAKIRAAVAARQDPNFLIIARTDARGIEGFDSMISRAQAYIKAGADMIFVEALATKDEFKAAREALNAPLLANMTEFGKSPLLSAKELQDLGFNLAIYPVTTLRLAMKAAEKGLKSIKDEGSQASCLDQMQTRVELYDLLRYSDYQQFDENISNYFSK